MNKEQIKQNIYFCPLIRIIPDKLFCQIHYRLSCKDKLDLIHPQTFNEKLNWLKIYDHNPKYSIMVDKYEVKQYVSSIVGDKYIIPTIGIYKHFDDIEFEKLPEKFVIKCTHDSGGVVICKNKNLLNLSGAKKKIEKSLKRNYYYLGREWPYKNVLPRIIVENYIEDSNEHDLKDYKFFCFDGKVKLIQVDFDRFINHKRNIYSPDWEYQDVFIHYPNDSSVIIPKPEKLSEMIEVAEKLSEGIPHLRVDLYSANGNVYFGELSFYHGSGYEKILPQEMNYTMGNWIDVEKMRKREPI